MQIAGESGRLSLGDDVLTSLLSCRLCFFVEKKENGWKAHFFKGELSAEDSPVYR